MNKYFQKKKTREFFHTLSFISELIDKLSYSTKRFLMSAFPSFYKNNSSQRTRSNLVSGFAILFAVLTASLLMSIGISIFGISIKELSLSTASKDSQIAFYAADSAIECAKFWDTRAGAFITYKSISSTTSSSITSIVCNGNSISLSPSINNSTHSYSYSFPNPFLSVDSVNPLSPEANLSITKTFIVYGGYIDTVITSYGHNVPTNAGKRIERGIKVDIINIPK